MAQSATSPTRPPRRETRRCTTLLLLIPTVLLAACGGGASDGGAVGDGGAPLFDVVRDATFDIRFAGDGPPAPRDTAGASDGKPDGRADSGRDAVRDAGGGPPCIDNSDCDSGFCVPSAQGPVCTRTCVEECWDGWACRPVGTSPDIIYLCVDLSIVLCRPCVDSGDCAEPRAGLDGYCLPSGPEGLFCGTGCIEDSDCAPGYACQTAATTEGESRSVCVFSDGLCGCTPDSIQHATATLCHVANEYGRCDGARRCAADGLTACDALVPAPETCDHVDNDCDGATDEDVSDPGAIGDPCDDDDDDDGVPDEDDCAPEDPAVGVCDDDNPCTEDRCNAAFGVCSFPPRAGACDDGDACTTGDHCESGACVFTNAVDFDDDDPCTADGCDPATGPWHAPLDAIDCDDDDPCTVGERCYAGLCGGGQPLDCDDDNACTDDTCRPNVEGGCFHTFNRTPCDDDDPCTVDDRCDQGACASGAPRDCDDDEPCTVDACDGETGECLHETLADNADCDDGDVCNGVQRCKEGICSEAVPPVVCDDEDRCNGVAHCDEGVCIVDAAPVVCEQDEDPCTEHECDPDTGACAGYFVNGCCAEDADCDDGDPCSDDVCVGDRCEAVPNGVACHPIVVAVALPEGAPPLSEAAYVLSPWGRHPVDADGRAYVNALADTAFPVVLVDGGLPLLAALVPPEVSSVTADPAATAATLLFLYANGLALPPQRVSGYAAFLAGFDTGGALATAVAAAVVGGESPFDARDADLLQGLQSALDRALGALLDWTTVRPLGEASWPPADGPPEAEPRAAEGFGVVATRVGQDAVRLTLQSRTPRPATATVRRRVEAGEEVVGAATAPAAACCTFTTPFAGTFGAATTEREAAAGTFVLDPGPQTFVVDVLAPGTPLRPIDATEAGTYVTLTREWVDGFAIGPVADWLESLRVPGPGGGCWRTVAGDWIAGRSAAWTPVSLEILDLADVVAALLVDVGHKRGAFGPCALPRALTNYLDALYGVAGLARRTPTAPPDASFGWMAGERTRPAHTSFAVADCLPDCGGAECGSDLCEGTCGACDGILNCVARQCRCEGTCGDLACGPSPCGEACGDCPTGRHCVAGACECDPPSAVGCADDALHWLDGCGVPVGEAVESCLLGCADGRMACNECDPLAACCQTDGAYVPPNVQAIGCAGTCRACDGAGGCGPATDGTACAGGVCVAGLCKSCVPGDVCCDAVGDFLGAGQNGAGCNGPCEQCNGGGACIPRPNRIDCPDGICWSGVCEQCEPGTLCCTPEGDFVQYGDQGPECTGTCRACNGSGRCGPAPDGATCQGGVCNGGSCRDCLAGSTCCDASGYFIPYAGGHIGCSGTCVQCDGFGRCADKAWHTTCGGGLWCEDGLCVPTCSDECTSGQRRCSGGAVQTCGNYDGDACREWGGDEFCACGCSGGTCLTGACTPGATSTTPCGSCGTQLRVCSGTCVWASSGSCTGQGTCTPGATESTGCGNCGSKSRTCTDQCAWGSYGSCTGQGECAPTTTQSTGCGNCGTKTRTCSAQCAWGSYGSCGGQGVCTPTATQAGSCDVCAQQTCQSNCQWGACALKSSSTCEWRSGTNWRCCGTHRWQYCLPPSYGAAGCKWSPDCNYVSNACY